MIRSDLRQQVRRHLAELSSTTFDDTTINTMLELVQQQMNGELNLLQKVAQLPFSGRYATLPTDFLRIGEDSVRLGTQVLYRMDYSDVLLRDQYALTTTSVTGVPRYYVWDEGLDLGTPNVLGLWPAGGSGNLSAVYVQRATTMTADSSTPWNGRYADYHGLIAMRAANQLQAQQGEMAAGKSTFYAIYQAEMANFENQLGRGKLSKRRRLVSTLSKGGWAR